MIITSLLDTDLYKFTMMQAVLHQFPSAQVSYKFKCRNPGVALAPYVQEIRDEIRSLCSPQDAMFSNYFQCIALLFFFSFKNFITPESGRQLST